MALTAFSRKTMSSSTNRVSLRRTPPARPPVSLAVALSHERCVTSNCEITRMPSESSLESSASQTHCFSGCVFLQHHSLAPCCSGMLHT